MNINLPIFLNGPLSSIFVFSYIFTAVVAPILDPFTPHETRTYSLWNSPGILDGFSSHLPESGATLGLNGNPWPTDHHFSYFQHQLEFPENEINIQDTEKKMISEDVRRPQGNERFTNDFPKSLPSYTSPRARIKDMQTPSEDVKRRKYSTVVETKIARPGLNKMIHKDNLISNSPISSGVDTSSNGKNKENMNQGLIQLDDARRSEESKRPEAPKLLYDSEERSFYEHEKELNDPQKHLTIPSKSVEMTEAMEGRKKSPEIKDESKLESKTEKLAKGQKVVSEEDHLVKSIEKSTPDLASQIAAPDIQRNTRLDSPVRAKGKNQDKINSGSKKSAKGLTIGDVFKGLPKPKESSYNGIGDGVASQHNGDFANRVRSSEFENENPYKLLEKDLKSDRKTEAKTKVMESDGSINVLADNSRNDLYSTTGPLTGSKLSEAEVGKLKAISETDDSEQKLTSQLPAKASHMVKKVSKKGKKKTKKKLNMLAEVDAEKEIQESSVLKGTTKFPHRCDPELQGPVGCNTEESFLELSRLEFLSRLLKLKSTTEGIKIKLTDLGFKYMMANGFSSHPKDWTDAIHLFAIEFGDILEGKRRLMSLLEQFKERHVVFNWENRMNTLSTEVRRIGSLLKADQIFPKFENAKIEEWKECHDTLLELIEKNQNDVAELNAIFGPLFQNRVATLGFMAYSHLEKQTRVLKEILEDGSVMEGVHIPLIMSIANILDLSSDTVVWDKLRKEDILDKASLLIKNLNGVILLPSGHKFFVFDHTWNSEYTMYRLIKKKDRIADLFQARIKTLANLSDKHNLKIPSDWLNKLPGSAADMTLGEALICLHVDLHFDALKELKEILKSQPRRANENSRIIGTWDRDLLPEHLLAKTLEFQRFFALRDQIVRNLFTL